MPMSSSSPACQAREAIAAIATRARAAATSPRVTLIEEAATGTIRWRPRAVRDEPGIDLLSASSSSAGPCA